MSEFWEDRAKKYGHTGWSDVLIYAYDQQARLLAIEKILKSLTYNKSVALDFGAGVGDFSNLLSEHFAKVISFDVSDNAIKVAQKKYGMTKNIQFICGNNIEDIGIPDNTVDLILSVTVLDHILDDIELINTVEYFETKMKRGGFFILFEYSLDYEKHRAHYQRFMKFDEWVKIFSEHNFNLGDCYSFYHPIEQPCTSYKLYRNSIKGYQEGILRILAKYGMNHTVSKYLTKLASTYLDGKEDFFWKENEKKSPLKIMVFKKAE